MEKKLKKRQQQEQKLQKSLQRCLLLQETEKNFWLQQIPKLPDSMLVEIYTTVESKNFIMDSYTREALKKDPDNKLLAELEQKISQIKKESLALEENAQTADPDAALKKQLKNI